MAMVRRRTADFMRAPKVRMFDLDMIDRRSEGGQRIADKRAAVVGLKEQQVLRLAPELIVAPQSGRNIFGGFAQDDRVFSASAEVQEAEVDEAEGGGGEAGEAEEHSQAPVDALSREESDRTHDEGDFEEGFAEVEAVGAVFGFVDYIFILVGGFFGFDQVLIPFLDVAF